MSREGWAADLPWGEKASVPADLPPYDVGRDHRRPVSEWTARGVRRADGQPLRVPAGTSAAVLLPGGQGDEAYVAYYPSFLAIRRYNPSGFLLHLRRLDR